MSQRVQANNKSAFGLYAFIGFLSLVFLGVGSLVYRAIQPTRLPNPGLAAYAAPAGVRTLYPQLRTSLFEDDIVPASVAAPEPPETEYTSPTTVRPTSRPARKAAFQASDRRMSSKRTAYRMRERQREVILTYTPNPEYGFKWGW